MSDNAAMYIGQLSPDRRWRWDGKTWTPTHLRWPVWVNFNLRARPTWIALVSALVVGLFADQALRVGAFGVGASVAVASATLVLVLVGRLRRIECWLLAAAAAAFGACLTVRASPWLLWPDVVATFALLGLAASIAVRGSLLNIAVAEGLARGVAAALHAPAGGALIVRPIHR